MSSVLVAEGDPAVRALIRALLSLDGHAVIEAEDDGAAAWNTLRSRSPDVVTLDLSLGAVDGLTLLGRLSAHPTLHRLPVIVVSGQAAPTDVRAAFGAGAAFFLAKPFSVAELRDLVRRCAHVRAPLRTDPAPRWARQQRDVMREAQLQRALAALQRTDHRASMARLRGFPTATAADTETRRVRIAALQAELQFIRRAHPLRRSAPQAAPPSAPASTSSSAPPPPPPPPSLGISRVSPAPSAPSAPSALTPSTLPTPLAPPHGRVRAAPPVTRYLAHWHDTRGAFGVYDLNLDRWADHPFTKWEFVAAGIAGNLNQHETLRWQRRWLATDNAERFRK
jgi:CheY-like chemotaxis protein